MRVVFAVVAVLFATIALAALKAPANAPTKSELLHLINDKPWFADHYIDLANTLSGPRDKVTLIPFDMTQQQLYKFAIALDRNNAVAYNNLALSLAEEAELNGGTRADAQHMTTTLFNGEKVTQVDLLLLAIEVDPNFSHAYNNLAAVMQPNQQLSYKNGTNLTHKDLYRRSIELDPAYVYPYNNLGALLEPDEQVVLHLPGVSRVMWNRADLFVRALELDAGYTQAARNLAAVLKAGEARKINGETWTKERLLERLGLTADDVDYSGGGSASPSLAVDDEV